MWVSPKFLDVLIRKPFPWALQRGTRPRHKSDGVERGLGATGTPATGRFYETQRDVGGNISPHVARRVRNIVSWRPPTARDVCNGGVPGPPTFKF